MPRILALPTLATIAILPACQSVSIVDEAQLGKPAMNFDQRGADSAECSLVTLLERGRATNSQNAGGVCAACH